MSEIDFKKAEEPFVKKANAYDAEPTFAIINSFNPRKRNNVYIFIYSLIKRFVDIVGSLIGIIVLSPVFLFISILIKRNDEGSAFYAHERMGYKGKRIKLYKFRSMKHNADKLEEMLTPEQLEIYRTEFKIENDPRITEIGNFLRKTSLDELPQMLNILKGDISIIGPRPIVEEELEFYGQNKELFLSVKPGLTGYWQAYARNAAVYSTGERQQMELHYIDNRSLWLDVKIFFKTILSVFKQDGSM